MYVYKQKLKKKAISLYIIQAEGRLNLFLHIVKHVLNFIIMSY